MSSEQKDPRWSDMALKKAQIIQPLCELRPIPGDKMAEACRAAEQVFGKPVTHQTIRNWIKVYERDGLSGLERKSYSSRGSQLDPRLEEVIIGILLNEKGFSIAETQRRAKKYGRNHLKLPEEQLPSYHQVLFLSQQLTEDEKTFAHKGTRSYTRNRELYGLFEADYANHIWQSDHHQLDIIVIDPKTGEQLGRPWMTAFLDDYSRAICGYYLSLDHPSSMSIALALRDSLLETDKKWNVVYGIPTIIYIDNGKDYRSRHIEEVCLHFGIEQRFHEGYRPQSKGKVERFFGTLETMCISTLDGYVGSNVQKRPHKVKPKLSMGKLLEYINTFLYEYHERRHGTTKRPPRDLWLENMTTPRPITDRRDLDYLLKVDNRIVQKQGISFKYSYWLDKENVLKGYIGQKVSIFYDPRDLTQISVWAMVNGEKQYICTAFDQGPKDTRREAGEVRAKNAPAKKDVRKRVRDYQKKGAVALQALEQMESVQTDKQEGENELSQEEPANQPSTQEAKSEEIPAQPEPKEPVPISAKQQKTQSAKTGRSVNDQEEEEEEYDWETMRRRLQRSKRER